MAGLEVLKKIMYAKEQYCERNGKSPDYLVISQNLYFRLYDYITKNFSLVYDENLFDQAPTIFGMTMKIISDKDFLMVGNNEIFKLKGEQTDVGE